MDLIIRNARLAGRPSDGPLDIGIERGRIVAIERELARRRRKSTTPRAGWPAPA